MTESPFDTSGDQWAWNSTSLGWLKDCPRKYYYNMIEQYRPRGSSVHLTFGILYHEALELYDRFAADGWEHEAALLEVVRVALTNSFGWESDHTKNRETLIRSIIWYLEQFGEEDPAHTIILANGKPAVELSFRLEFGKDMILCGHLDRVAEYNGDNYIIDRKTTGSTVGSYYFDRYEPDTQMSLYTLAAKIVYGTPVKGVLIDAAQIAVGFTRFARGYTFRTDAQLTEWLDSAKWWVAQVPAMRKADWPMNESSCQKYGGCIYRGVCSKSPQVRQRFLDSDFEKVDYNPLKIRGE